jgi:hypothetical protein
MNYYRQRSRLDFSCGILELSFFGEHKTNLVKKYVKFVQNQQLSQAVVAGSSETQTKHTRKSIPDFDKLRLLCY